MKTIKNGLVAAAFVLGISGCNKDDNRSMVLENLDVVGCSQATAHFDKVGYAIICDKNHYFVHSADIEDSDDLIWGNEDYHDANKDRLVDVYFNNGQFQLNNSAVIDSRYETLLSKLNNSRVNDLWVRNWRQKP